MNNVLIFLLATAFFSVALVSGGIAKLFKAKRPFMLLAVLVVALAVGAGVGIHQYRINDSLIVLATILVTYSLLLSLLLGMKMLDTLITTIAGIATMGMVLFAGGMALEKYQNSSVLDTMLSYVEDNQSFISFAAIFPKTKHNTAEIDDGFISYSEQALIPDGARKRERALESKTYHTVKVTEAYKLKGNTVRILKKNGDILQGSITTTRANSLILGIYVPESKGMIVAPVPLSVISKLEVYRE